MQTDIVRGWPRDITFYSRDSWLEFRLSLPILALFQFFYTQAEGLLTVSKGQYESSLHPRSYDVQKFIRSWRIP